MKEISIKGYNLDRFLNNVLECGIKPKTVRRVQYDELTIEISDKDYKNLLVKKFASCYNINVLKSKAKLSTLFSIFKRVGLLAGALVVLVVILNSSNKLAQISIVVNGDDDIEIKRQAEIILKEHNIVIGEKFKDSYRDLENILVAELEKSANVLVKRTGNELVINITQIVEKPEVEHLNIVSSYDGKITGISYSSGHLRVNIGEGVVKGQILIESGYVGDFFTEAQGEIIAQVTISGSAVGSTKLDSYKRTGQKTILRELQIFNKNLDIGDATTIDGIYEFYEVEQEEVYLTENMILPLKLIKFHVYELERSETYENEELVIENLKNEAYNVARQNLPSGAEEESVTYESFNENGFIKVVCNIETEVSIGERK